MRKADLLKILDPLAGRLLLPVLSRPCPNTAHDFRRILIIRPGGIGDAVLLASPVKLIKQSYPDTHITILAERRNSGTFTLIPQVDKVLCYDRIGNFVQALRDYYDVVIDTEQWYRLSAMVARLVRAPVKIGFDSNERRSMFTHCIPYDQNAYEADNFLALLEPLGVSVKCDAGEASLVLPPQSVSKAVELLKPLCSDSFVVIFPGASIQEKRWGGRRFCLVAKRLAENGYKVVVVGGREEWADGNMIVGGGGLNLAGRTTLAETAAVIARSSLMISGDSGVLHIAAGLGIPTVSLFGPSNANKWAPKGERHVVLNHHLPCSPCSKFGSMPSCPIDLSCIKDITPDEVITAIGRLLSQPPEKK